MFSLKHLRLREQRRQSLQKFAQKAPQPPALKPPSTARTAGRSDWAGRRFRRQPFILLSFSSSEKPQKRRKRSHTNVSNTLVARPSTPPAQTPQRSFRGTAAGVHTPPQPLTAHTAAHRAKQGRFRWGWYHYPRRALCGPEPLRAQRSEEHTLPSLHGPGERRREAESLRNGDAHRARLRSEAPRPRRVALLHCCFLRCTSKLRGSLSLRRRAERKIC